VFRIEAMTQADVPEVSRVERKCFDNPWPLAAYRRELRNTLQNFYIVLRMIPDADGATELPPPRESVRGEGRWSLGTLLHLPRRFPGAPGGPHVAGFGGMWIVYDEAHITTIGVDPIYRGRGFGELLLLGLFEEAIGRGAQWLTLEVRVSNEVAQALYRKYGMSVHLTRKRYYSDNGEDAYVMWSRSLRDADYLELIQRLRDGLAARLGPEIEVPSRADAPWVNEGRER
jgi:ribosomal-protein-alanine N-acetyltransferase